jgi:hypothetical protein
VGRGDGLGEEVDAFAGSGLGDGAGELLLELGELGLLATEARMLRAVRVVEVEQRALREGIAAALRGGVLGIAFELDGAEGLALDQHRNRAGGERMRRGEVHRAAEDEVLGLLDVGEDRLVGLLGAAGESGQREARAHDLEEAAARDRVDPLAGGGLAGKLLLHQLLEGRRSGQLIQVLPEALAGLAFELRAHLGESHLRRRDGVDHLGLLFLSHRLLHLHGCRLHRWHTSQLASSLAVRMWYWPSR